MSDNQAEIIESQQQIVRILQKAAVEEQTVEVQINQRTRLFFSVMMDQLPDLLESVDPQGVPVLVEPEYRPFSYLDNKTHLLISPLYPAIGNAQIRSSESVLIRFFDGVKSYEADLVFANTAFVRGEPGIALTFPVTLNLFRRRRFFRADLPANIDLKLQVKVGKNPPSLVRLMNISPGGLAFCGEHEAEALPLESQVGLILESNEVPSFQITGIIRSCSRTSPKDGCPLFPNRFGVQFELLTEQMARRIEEVTAYAQRIHLRRTLALRARMEPVEPSRTSKKEETAKPREEKVEELMKFFGLKKEFKFK
ncbi:MAG: hypothetical protein G8345_08240 [Magnetococcales bacterium]|nr:hypothetical protein [Magnetococcales bacterium]